jgi:hypothetical protein
MLPVYARFLVNSGNPFHKRKRQTDPRNGWSGSGSRNDCDTNKSLNLLWILAGRAGIYQNRLRAMLGHVQP